MKAKKVIALFLSLSMFLLALAGCGTSSNDANSKSSEDPIVISIAHTDSSNRSTNECGIWLNDYLQKETNGKVAVEMYPDGQLGDDPDLAAGVKLGNVTIYFGLASVISSIVGEKASCVDLPYLYSTYDEWVQGTFENGGLELFNEALEGSGYTCLDMMYNGMRCVASSKKIYHNSDDLKGQKVRIAQNDLNVKLWQSMGANPTPMAWGEVITSLSQGTVDALDHSLGVFNDFNIHEIAPYVTVTNHCSSPYPVICSTEWLNSLDDETREKVVDGVHQMCEKQRVMERENELSYLERFEQEGATVYTLSAQEQEALKEAVKPVYKEWRKRVGDDVIDAWLATVPQ
ncbi:TRAP transporter substrate-binding protein [Anaerovorax sp. IOR16]|uniref:TRAP transporter substrate-binding protein n=1 Tax=Anaerovorax sp. IOR16 TaxID=2773458 RepID=UPI0019CF82BB|nr:TRAP transporter substrate-binding protein [Anaerovorax sp. IOR16]